MRKSWLLAIGLVGALSPRPGAVARAHWCSSIFETAARVVVKPERDMVFLGGVGEQETFRVSVRNTYPYLLTNVRMRVQDTTGFEVAVAPAQQDIYPEQSVTFDFTVRRTSGEGDAPLRLEIAFLVDTNENRTATGTSKWRDAETDLWTSQAPASLEATLQEMIRTKPQSRALSAAKLAELSPQGVDTLLATCGRPRLQYDGSGDYGGGTWYAARSPRVASSDWKLVLRCLVATAIVNPDDARVTAAFLAAMDDPDPFWRGTAAVLAASARPTAETRRRISAMAETDPCADAGGRCANYAWTSSDDAKLLARAALLVLEDDDEGRRAAVQACSTGHADPWARMTCATALGLAGDDATVKAVLLPMVEDRHAFLPLTAPSMLQLVARRRLATQGCVSFFGEEGCRCTAGERHPCYSGPPGTQGVGVCAAGTRACESGRWGACQGDVRPSPEDCTNHLDDDCDGKTDLDDLEECAAPPSAGSGGGGGCSSVGPVSLATLAALALAAAGVGLRRARRTPTTEGRASCTRGG